MKKLLILSVFILHSISSFAQNPNAKLIELAKAYRNFMFMATPPKGAITKLQENVPAELSASTAFIVESITQENKLATKTYLTLPDEKTLQYLFWISNLSQNMIEGSERSNETILDSLSKLSPNRYVWIDSYYNMLFTGIGNKHEHFNLSKVNFTLDEYNLKDDTEKGILFLRCISLCRSMIWGYMNIVKPANTKEAYSYIKKFPKVNGLAYYQYKDLYFTDFEVIIDGKTQSFKTYYIDQYYDLLLYHLVCMKKEGASEDEMHELMLGSIMKDEKLYKYTKNKATLEKIFQKK